MEGRLTLEDIRGGIRVECVKGELTIKQIATKFNVSTSTVMKWKFRPNVYRKKRVGAPKLKQNHLRYIYKLGNSKYTSIENASSRKITSKFNKKFRSENISVTQPTVNKYLNQLLSKPRRVRTTFKMNYLNKLNREDFCKDVKNVRPIKGEEIFFTDEKRFYLDAPYNPKSNQIRFSKKNLKKLNQGNQEMYEKLNRPLPKYSSSFMIAAGLSAFGPGKLIFCVGNMDTNAYLKTLNYFKEDIERINSKNDVNLWFQQDNAPCHKSAKSMTRIRNHFDDQYIPNWPANSPDLSPIENLWSIVQEKLQATNYSTLEEMK